MNPRKNSKLLPSFLTMGLLLASLCPLCAQEDATTPDGILLKNTQNTLERPYRPAGNSDPRLDNPALDAGFGRRDRRLVYVAVPGGTSGGQVDGEATGSGIVVLQEFQDPAWDLTGHKKPGSVHFHFVKRIPTWNGPASESPPEVSGIAASPATNLLYLTTRGKLQAFDLSTDKEVWEETYDGHCAERAEVTPDGRTLIAGSDLQDYWYVIDAATGRLKGKIMTPMSKQAHNMGISADGKTVFMAPNGVTLTVGDVASMKATETITFSDHIRPFVINHDATLIYANVNNLLGFEIADVRTGKVVKRIEAPAYLWKAQWHDTDLHFYGHACPSHGIGLTPDESELWLADDINYQILVYDNTGRWPKLKSFFRTTSSADWITMGLDGQYCFLSSGDVVDVKTHTIVAQLKDEYGRTMHSEKLLEMTFHDGRLQRTESQFAEGLPDAVNARLARLASATAVSR